MASGILNRVSAVLYIDPAQYFGSSFLDLSDFCPLKHKIASGILEIDFEPEKSAETLPPFLLPFILKQRANLIDKDLREAGSHFSRRAMLSAGCEVFRI